MAVAGVFSWSDQKVEQGQLERMLDAGSWHGPDGRGVWVGDGACLGSLRFHTTPEAVNSPQPIGRDERWVLCLDGHLSNRGELFSRLGLESNEVGDAELAYLAFLKWGRETPQLLVGDFTLVVWDRLKRELFCAQSPVGFRPLFWFYRSGQLAIAREISQLLTLPFIPKRINQGAAAEMCACRFMSQDETLLEGVLRVPPGGTLVVGVDGPAVGRWHRGPFASEELPNIQAYAERFRELFDQSLVANSRSTGPVGAHLSGGLDSSSVVCRLHRLYAAGQVAHPTQAVSAIFPGTSSDESSWIAGASNPYGIQSELVLPRTYDWDEMAEWCSRTAQLPLRPNGYSLANLNRALGQKGIRVVLTGEGGDDWLTGNLNHWLDLTRQLRVGQILREWLQLSPDFPDRTLRGLISHTLGMLLRPSRQRQRLAPHLRFTQTVPPWVRSEWAAKVDLTGRAAEIHYTEGVTGFAPKTRTHPFSLARRHINVENVVSYSVAQGVEIRHPYHDRRLAEWIVNLPGEVLFKGGLKKHLLRAAMHDTLPPAISERRCKTPFDSVFFEAMRTVVSQDKIKSLIPVQEGWLDGQVLWDQWLDEERRYEEGKPHEALIPLWLGLALDLWIRKVIA